MQSTITPDPALVDLFRGVRQDARSTSNAPELARTFTIDIAFDGAGALPTVGSCYVMPLGLIRARIVGACIVANGVGSATIDVRLGTQHDSPNLGPIYGASVTNIPRLTAAAQVTLDTSAWTVNLQPTDVLIATLRTVSSVIVAPAVGAMTSLTFSLFCRHLKWPAGSANAVDSSGNTVVDSFGNIVTNRR